MPDRQRAEPLREAYLEIEVDRAADLEAGAAYWHEVVGATVRDSTGAVLGSVADVYRAGETEVYVVRGGPPGEFDVPAVRDIITTFAPERGEIVVDEAVLDLGAPPVEAQPSGPEGAAASALVAPRQGREARDRRGLEARRGPRRPGRRRRATGEGARMTLEIDVVCLFPAMVEGPLSESIPGRTRERGLVDVRVHDLRRWGLGRHRSVDDTPYGGGAGMVLRPEPVAAALDELRRPESFAILLDPGGEVFRQARAADLAARPHLILVCPRYEGVDDRIRSLFELELSIGDYVLSGGELAALVVIDAVTRLLPGAIDDASTVEESFSAGLLEYPQFTRPAEFRGQGVPDVLVSGHHEQVRRWRREAALKRTRERRPDLAPPEE